MAINFPTSLDNFTNPSSGNTLDSPSHSLQHSDINDAVEALERKVGLGTAVAGSASAGQVLTISAAGTSTWSTPTAGGLVLISTTSFTTQSSVRVNPFSATYQNYRIVLNVTQSNSTPLKFRVASGASVISTTTYERAGFFTKPTTPSTTGYYYNATAETSIIINDRTAAAVEFTLFQPFDAAVTFLNGLQIGRTDGIAGTISGYNTNATSYDGFELSPDAGTITGTLRVYGYNN